MLEGDLVEVVTQKANEPEVDFNYQVLYEDEALFVIQKPGNLPVHPSGRFFFHTLLTHLKTQGFTQPLSAEREFFLAHRIDKETSGILVLAKKKEVCAQITEQFAQRIPRKKYLAVVYGTIPEDQFQVTLPLGRKPNSVIALKVYPLPEDQGGQSAQTDFRVLKRFKDFTLVECSPKTGRQHQIRVHLAEYGYPIVGDKLYSLPEEKSVCFYQEDRPKLFGVQCPEPTADSPSEAEDTAPALRPMFQGKNQPYITAELEARLLLPRHALHAAEIEFIHPLTQKWMHFQAPLPKDLECFVEGRESSPPS